MTTSDIIKNAPLPIWESKQYPKLSFNNRIMERMGAFALYIDFRTDWLIAQATRKHKFSWGWGKLNFSSVAIYEPLDETTYCPVMEFDEFYALLRTAYILY